MEKLRLLRVFAPLVLSLFCCRHLNDHPNRPKFDGVDIEGTKQDYIQQMKSKGYSLISDSGNVVTLERNVDKPVLKIEVSYTPKSQLVYDVAIFSDEKKSWTEAVNAYSDQLTLLKEKYGRPDHETSAPIPQSYSGNETVLESIAYMHTATWKNIDTISIYLTILEHRTMLRYSNQSLDKLLETEEEEADKEKKDNERTLY